VGRRIERILIIEDNRDTALSLRLLLRKLKLDVGLAFSGLEGVEKARQSAPDVILCDIGLPGLDGYAVARELRSNGNTRDTFLIAQSGYGQADDIRKAYDAGFDVHLTKPVEFQDLTKILTE